MEIVNPKIERIIRQGLGYKNLPKLDLNEYDVYNQIQEDHPLYKKIVEEVLSNWSPATNNDLLLYIEVLRTLNKCHLEDEGTHFTLRFKKSDIAFLPQSESITRARRSLNRLGKCLPTDSEVLEHRSLKCKAMKKYMNKNV